MGLFDFVKAAGQKLGLVDEDDDAEKATALKKEIDKYDLGSDKIDVTVAGDKVLLKGEAPSQEALEKIVLAAGNVEGVGKVETDVAAPEAREPVFHTVKKGESLWKIAETLAVTEQDVIDNWAEDKRWEPRMDSDERERLYRQWKKAVVTLHPNDSIDFYGDD